MTKLLGVEYADLVERVKQGGSDDEIIRMVLHKGRKPSDEEVYIWNEFMRKYGWNDKASEILVRRKKESGMAGRSEIKRCSRTSMLTKAAVYCRPSTKLNSGTGLL